jgi:Pyridoxamine 5'-phosphate oxidase
MTATPTTESLVAPEPRPGALPDWPRRTIAILTTLGEDEPHAIPVSAPVRAGDRRILLNLHRTRESLLRLRQRPRVALTILAGGNTAFTARGPARIVQEPMPTAPDYAVVAIDVEQVDDHRQPAFEVEAGVERRWLNENERDALGQRIRSLIDAPQMPSRPQRATQPNQGTRSNS